MLSSSAFAKLFKVDSEWDSIHKLTNLFKEAGNASDIINQVVELKCIKNYENLYENYRRLTPDARHHINSAWQLLLLSGELTALDYAIAKLGVTKNTQNELGENALHLAALSGNYSLVEEVERRLHIPWDSQAANHCNILHYAIMSGKIELVEKILKKHQESNVSLSYFSSQNRHILHFAAAMGKLEIVAKIFALLDEKTSASIDEDGYSAVNYAIKHYNERVVNFLLNKGLKPLGNQDNFNFGEVGKTWKLELENKTNLKM